MKFRTPEMNKLRRDNPEWTGWAEFDKLYKNAMQSFRRKLTKVKWEPINKP
jgi:hypothetical protein